MDDRYQQERYELLEDIDAVAKKLAEHDPGHIFLNLAVRITEFDDFYHGKADEETLELLAEYKGEEDSEHDALVNFMAAMENVIEDAEEDEGSGESEKPRAAIPA